MPQKQAHSSLKGPYLTRELRAVSNFI